MCLKNEVDDGAVSGIKIRQGDRLYLGYTVSTYGMYVRYVQCKATAFHQSLIPLTVV